MATAKLADILEAARALSRDERRRLVLELDALVGPEDRDAPPSSEPLAALRALSGTAHSSFTDLSTNKYTHVAAAALDPEG
jgi:hypothetical protein